MAGFGRQRRWLVGKVLINMTVFTTKLYTRYYYSRQEEYRADQDKHFRTEKSAQEYANANERDFPRYDTRYRYEIVKHNMDNPKFHGEPEYKQLGFLMVENNVDAANNLDYNIL